MKTDLLLWINKTLKGGWEGVARVIISICNISIIINISISLDGSASTELFASVCPRHKL